MQDLERVEESQAHRQREVVPQAKSQAKMITFTRGNLFESDAQALVNTVNCVGVMGKGIAYQFARAYPAMVAEYTRQCRRREIRLGTVTLVREAGRVIINFPTKDHWKSRSRLEDVREGLKSLREVILRERIQSIALPPLGCGNGGLQWKDVQAIIVEELDRSELHDVRIDVYEPAGDFSAKAKRAPRLSLGHFVLVAMRLQLKHATKLSIHKSAYFFNVFHGAGYFRFTRHRFGPYSLAIDPMTQEIRDYLDFTKVRTEDLVEDALMRALAGKEADRLRGWLPTISTVATFCNRHDASLEALATVHELLREEGPLKESEVVRRFMGWSEEKPERFSATDVLAAIGTLVEEKLVEPSLLGFRTTSPWRPETSDASHGDFDPLRR